MPNFTGIGRVVLAVFGVLLMFTGGLLLIFAPIMISSKMSRQEYLGRDANGEFNEMLKNYVLPPYSIKLEIWTFSVQNKADTMMNRSAPIVVEKGPYTFTEKQHKVGRRKNEPVWFSENDTHLLYHNDRAYFFDQGASCSDCRLSDRVVVPNVVFQKIADWAGDSTFWAHAIDVALSVFTEETAFINVTVNQLLFKGYKDPLIGKICSEAVLEQMCLLLKVQPRIGIFYGQNNTDDGLYEINTGRANISDIGHVFSWNNLTQLNRIWPGGREAQQINGTDSQLYAPKFLLGHPPLQVFVGQACRTVEMEYLEDGLVDGVPTVRYGPSRSMGDMELQKRMGFCLPNTPKFFEAPIQIDGCLPSRLMDMRSCLPFSPSIFASAPHFYGSPPELAARIRGMRRASADDATVVEVEPNTGIVVAAQKRSQINVGMARHGLNFVKMDNLIMPMVWMNETVMFDVKTRDQLRSTVSIIAALKNASVALLALGVTALVIFGAWTTIIRLRRRDSAESDDNIDSRTFNYNPLVNETSNVEPSHRENPNPHYDELDGNPTNPITPQEPNENA